MNLFLQQRDIRSLSYIYDNGFAPADILRDLYWNGRKDNSHYKRLRKLAKAGLIEPLNPDGIHRLSYCTTPKGVTALRSRGGLPNEGRNPRPRYADAFEHDRSLHRVRQVFESMPNVENYHSEIQVQKLLAERHGFQKEKDHRYKVPDALFTLKLPDKAIRVAVELERNGKSLKRTRRLMEMLATSPDFETTFFVVSSLPLMLRLKRILNMVRTTNVRVKQLGGNHGFYFVLLDDLLKLKSHATLEGEGTRVVLADLMDSRPQLGPTPSPCPGPCGVNA